MTTPAGSAPARATETHLVGAGDTAAALGSGDLAMLATPRLVAWLEAACCAAVAAQLGSEESTVGTRVIVDHLKPSCPGATVETAATLGHSDGRLLRFEVVATDADGVVLAHGEMTRVRVDRARFLARSGVDRPG